MKKYAKYLIPIFLLVFLFSCEIENDTLLSPEETSIDSKNNLIDAEFNSENIFNSDISKGGNPEDEVGKFIDHMQWTSFITGEIIDNDTSLRLYIMSQLSTSDAIHVEDLIGANTNNQSFHDAFESLLYSYFAFGNSANGCPEGDKDHPPIIIGNGAPVQTLVDLFIKYIAVDNCVELYFPNNLDFSAGYTVTSTAHPLSTVNSNIGYERRNSLCGDETLKKLVNTTYVSNNPNIVVARPLIITTTDPDDPCNYRQYGGIDFTDFLSSSGGGA